MRPTTPLMRCGKTLFVSFLTTSEGYATSRDSVWESSFLLIDDIRDRAPRRPDEQFTKVVPGSAGVCFDGLVEGDAVNAEISMSCGDRARYIKPGCRVRVFLAIERV